METAYRCHWVYSKGLRRGKVVEGTSRDASDKAYTLEQQLLDLLVYNRAVWHYPVVVMALGQRPAYTCRVDLSEKSP